MKPHAVTEINRKIDEAITTAKAQGATGQADLKHYQANVERMHQLFREGQPADHPEMRELAANVAATEATFGAEQ